MDDRQGLLYMESSRKFSRHELITLLGQKPATCAERSLRLDDVDAKNIVPGDLGHIIRGRGSRWKFVTLRNIITNLPGLDIWPYLGSTSSMGLNTFRTSVLTIPQSWLFSHSRLAGNCSNAFTRHDVTKAAMGLSMRLPREGTWRYMKSNVRRVAEDHRVNPEHMAIGAFDWSCLCSGLH
jgi:hypothetical protein